MKLKEFPISIYKTIKLSRIRLEKLLARDKNEVPVVVSLTSIPSRLAIVHLVIRSLLDQQVLPKKIVLWLHKDLENRLPQKLRELQGDTFEIRYSGLTCSHRKLIYALEQFPDDIIVTCDDDLLYGKLWLKSLYEEHLLNSKAIVANQTRYISYDADGNLLPYKQWRHEHGKHFNQKAVLPIGAGGVLYPPHSLDKRTTNQDLFLKLTPKADDLWFKAMALLKGTDSFEVENKTKSPIPIFGSQKQSLKKTNVDGDKNSVQWRNVTAYFNIKIGA